MHVTLRAPPHATTCHTSAADARPVTPPPLSSLQVPLPRELKRHMFVIEERIVEGLAWVPGSPLYALLRQAAQANGMAPPPAAAAAADGQPAELQAVQVNTLCCRLSR